MATHKKPTKRYPIIRMNKEEREAYEHRSNWRFGILVFVPILITYAVLLGRALDIIWGG